MTTAVLLNNRYLLEEPQATGGMAEVFRGRDLTLERTVAIKILRKDYSSSPEFRQRFHQEAKAAANLSHPNIATIYDFGLDQDRLFIVMEFVPGTDLKNILRQRGRLPIDEALGLVLQACAGIGHAHRAGLVHCDLKPQNLLVTPEQQVKVVDFGIAHALASLPHSQDSKVVWGSPLYFSPEQASGQPPSPASDVYSLGVVLFELLTGQTPFHGNSAEELGQQHLQMLPPSPRKLNPTIPSELDQVVLRMLEKVPLSRYRSADQVSRVLSSFLQHQGPEDIGNQFAVSPRPEPSQQAGEIQFASIPVANQVPVGPSQPVPLAPVMQTPPVQISTSSTKVVKNDRMDSRVEQPKISRPSIDWFTWLLVLLAIITVGGLIPFWLWVYYSLNPLF